MVAIVSEVRPTRSALDELWRYAVEYLLDNCNGRGVIARLLAAAGGHVERALELMTVPANPAHPDWGSPAQSLGSWGLCGAAGRLQCSGSAGQNPIHAWFPEPSPFNRPPDLVISWREVFVFVATGGRQLRLLEDA